ncbi:hypothetical protein Pelo_10126 [Pelomyxa schiedti]|nr:hypothetical protein Pelo_10126 [Pelomyxa schiedti]
MKRRRRGTGPRPPPPLQSQPGQTSPGAVDGQIGLDQLLPSAVLDLIVAYLMSPPFPSPAPPPTPNASVRVAVARSPAAGGVPRGVALINFALCSSACLAACERASMTLRVRSLARPRFGLLALPDSDGGDDEASAGVSERLVRRDRDEEAELQEAVLAMHKALYLKKWIRSVHESVLGAMRHPVASSSAHVDDEGMEWFTSRVYCVDSEREEVDHEEDYTELVLKGVVWFYPRTQAGGREVTRRDQRVFVYCHGHLSTEADEEEAHITVWYCISDCGCVPRPPASWVPLAVQMEMDMHKQMQGQNQMTQTDGREDGTSSAPWVRVAEKDLNNKWRGYQGNKAVEPSPVCVTLCGLAGFPADQSCEFLTAIANLISESCPLGSIDIKLIFRDGVECVDSFIVFPDTVVSFILSFVLDYDDLLSCRLACRRFKNLLNAEEIVEAQGRLRLAPFYDAASPPAEIASWRKCVTMFPRTYMLDLRSFFNSNVVLPCDGHVTDPGACSCEGLGSYYFFAVGSQMPKSGLYLNGVPSQMGWVFSETRNAIVQSSNDFDLHLTPLTTMHTSDFPSKINRVILFCTLGCNHGGTPISVDISFKDGSEVNRTHVIPDWNGFSPAAVGGVSRYCTGPRMQPGTGPDGYPWTIYQVSTPVPPSSPITGVHVRSPHFSGGYLVIMAATLQYVEDAPPTSVNAPVNTNPHGRKKQTEKSKTKSSFFSRFF